jgi:hypothetical protein
MYKTSLFCTKPDGGVKKYSTPAALSCGIIVADWTYGL